MKKTFLLLALIAVTGCNQTNVVEPVKKVKVEQPAQQFNEKKDTPVATFKKHFPINIVYAGDAMMDMSVKTYINKNGVDAPFKNVKKEVENADFAFVNLETSVTNATKKDTVQIFNFKSDPKSLKGLKNAGFDMVSLANNHVMDYHMEGFKDTIKSLNDNELMYVGAGMDAKEAYSAKTVELNGKKVKFLAFSRFIPSGEWFAKDGKPGIAEAYEQSKVLNAIKKERMGADYLLVYIHWGVERDNKPQAWQREFAKKMIDQGADAIIGSHPHVLQGFEFYKDKPIAYSIGNFLFPDYIKGKSADTGLLHVILDNGDVNMEFNPYFIKNNVIVKNGQNYVDNQLSYLQNISYGVQFVDKRIEQRAKKVSK